MVCNFLNSIVVLCSVCFLNGLPKNFLCLTNNKKSGLTPLLPCLLSSASYLCIILHHTVYNNLDNMAYWTLITNLSKGIKIWPVLERLLKIHHFHFSYENIMWKSSPYTVFSFVCVFSKNDREIS